MTQFARRSSSWRGTPRRLSRLGWTAIIALVAACGGDAPTLGSAEQLAAGGNASWSDIRDTRDSENLDQAVRLDDLPLEEAALLLSSGESKNVALLFEQYGVMDSRVIASTTDGMIVDWSTAPVSASATQTAADITASGRLVTASDGDLGRALSGEPVGPSEIAADGQQITVYEPVSVPLAEHPSPFPVGALDLAEDGSVLAGGLDETRIARIDADGTTTHLLGPEGTDAQVTDDDLGPVVAVMSADDDRVVFVAGTDGDTRLYVLDDAGVREIPSDDNDGSPVAGTDLRRAPVYEEPFPRAAITPLAPSPDGRILTTGIGPDGDPQIALIDIDTDDIEILAVLDDVEPTIDDPVSAAIIGNDLVFLARHQLWRHPDIITPDDP